TLEELRRPTRRARRHAQDHARRAPGDHRTERRRQDDPVQFDYRNFPGHLRTSRAVRPGRDQVAEPSAHSAWNGANLSEYQPVSKTHRSRQRVVGDPGAAAVEVCGVAGAFRLFFDIIDAVSTSLCLT